MYGSRRYREGHDSPDGITFDSGSPSYRFLMLLTTSNTTGFSTFNTTNCGCVSTAYSHLSRCTVLSTCSPRNGVRACAPSLAGSGEAGLDRLGPCKFDASVAACQADYDVRQSIGSVESMQLCIEKHSRSDQIMLHSFAREHRSWHNGHLQSRGMQVDASMKNGQNEGPWKRHEGTLGCNRSCKEEADGEALGSNEAASPSRPIRVSSLVIMEARRAVLVLKARVAAARK
ncbi:uncharacterized protein LAESUDRAFT_714140 [Laetiporus sulphureus 93-53]|uniref:Uncharacterized protein n=1 Tax=Laetiporus sulphureus 93-53 TaxID=1314785 RepID=A0A165EBZ6_9APHY|nr:uncharacterized protein LAESUDRAFT_714140 [Laetiporus sulphureus 93-53]KZT06694.1 hypothetical protein LAESUDRAFT_714140 [Laetiporus sulphureus 93-53]